jgi:protein-tyrosine phosphatase
VHCFAGIGRTGTVVGCYLRRHALANPGKVVEQIAQLRRLMPWGREISPHTPEQVQMAENWQDGA